MPGAPLPSPQYIDYTDNVAPFIGVDKVLVANDDSTAIPTATANQLIAEGEALALQDISPYFVTQPALITTSGGDWTTLQTTNPMTYNTLYYMFVVQASLKLIGWFIAKNTDQQGTTLSYFQNFTETEYAKYNNRILNNLTNGSYRFQMFAGLQTLNTGIPRSPKCYAIPGNMGVGNYTDGQVTNPGQNFDIFWGRFFGGRGGW